MNRRAIAGLALGASAAALCAAVFAAPAPSLQLAQIGAKPIPPGYNFPTATPTILGWVATSNTAAIRAHSWDIWAGMTANSGEVYQGAQLPIWETWYGSDDVFPSSGSSDTTTATLASKRRTLRAFIRPHQFAHTKAGRALALGPPAARVVSFNKFSPEAAGFILKPQPGPGAKTYRYNSSTSLNALNNAWPTAVPPQHRAVNDFPDKALETKPVFSTVSAAGLTPQPLWQGPSASTNPTNPTPDTWTTCVLIDPTGTTSGIQPATPAQIAGANKVSGLACKTYFYGALSTFYSFKMSAAEAAAFNNAQGGSAKAGDFAVLVAMHVNSKEIPFWTWQTFYWQPGPDTPNGFPGSKAGQPASLKAPWTNYASCSNYDQTTKPHGTTMEVCFNPYLETSPGIPAGITSNCMSCHGTARVGKYDENNPYPANYNAAIAFFTDPLYFNNGTTHTDFSWAVADAP